MGFCTEDEHEHFLREVPAFEGMLVDSGVRLVKLWLDVSRKEQKKRLEERRTDPLKVLKSSPLDEAAQSRFDNYSEARDSMLRRTHSENSPWTCVRSDQKKPARLAILRHLVRTLAPEAIAGKIEAPDPAILFPFDLGALSDGRLAR
jgi:polyphosphate kinase 2 (PPK2 family)